MNYSPTRHRRAYYPKRRGKPYASSQNTVIFLFMFVSILISILMPIYIASLPLRGF